ncbi:hypothetical protein BG015_006413 [Linnemannia schmuckeri]|uniref:PUM-HD domain-containing protein n=1 Tax=Linnemannia schmuckeri TaxID=64567 RepID=A0A9P5VBJ2_9FUNG|nr:hypothetical protein BG015_006413 [Linnemannia schmuckeri]
MTGPLGKYLCQKLLGFYGDERRTIIVENVASELVNVSLNIHDTRARCIDHASVSQKIQRFREITYNANYVVQYVLDLADNRFTDAPIHRFIGNICAHSVQKFSSNVMEEYIRVTEPDTRKFLIEEMINKTRLDKLLRASYANCVVQISFDLAGPIQRTQLAECIRPLLPAIRNTPYGKRIQGKLHRDQMSGVNNSTAHLGMGGTMDLNGDMGNMNNNMAVMNGMGGMNGAMSMAVVNGMNGMPNHEHNMGMNGGMNEDMNGDVPMINMGHEWRYERRHEWRHERDESQRQHERQYSGLWLSRDEQLLWKRWYDRHERF